MRSPSLARVVMLSIALSACAGRHSQGPAKPGPGPIAFDRTAETKAVYVAVLRDAFATDWLGRPVRQFVIDPEIPASRGGRDEMARSRASGARADTFADLERAGPTERVPADLDPGLPVRWFTEAEFAALPKSSASDLGWAAFHQKFPGSGGHVTLSRVGFSADGTEALLQAGRWFDSLGGASQVVWLRKAGGVWKVKSRSTTVVS